MESQSTNQQSSWQTLLLDFLFFSLYIDTVSHVFNRYSKVKAMTEPTCDIPAFEANDPNGLTIITKPFALTPETYLRILLRNASWNRWWLMAIIAICMFFFLFLCCSNDENIRFGGFFWSIISGAYLLFSLFYYYFIYRRTAYHPASKVLMKTRQMTLTKDLIIANVIDDGGVSRLKKEEIFRIEQCKNYYMIWIAPHMFLYLAKDAFQNQEDLKTFEEKILPEYPQLKRKLRYGIYYIIAVLGSILLLAWILIALNKP